MNAGLKALKKASPEAYANIMGMDKKELGKMADKGLKILKQYFSGGVVPHAAYTPIGMQAQQRAGMQNFVTAAANAEIDRDRKKKKGKKEPMEETTSMKPEIIAQNVEPRTIMGDESGVGLNQAKDLMIQDVPIPMAMSGMKVMKDGGLYADNGKKNDRELTEEEKKTLAMLERAIGGQGGDGARQPGTPIVVGGMQPSEVLDTGVELAQRDNTANVMIIDPPIPGRSEPVQPEPVQKRPDGISPLRTLKAGPLPTDIPKELLGGIREIETPTGPKYTFEAKAMPGNPTGKPMSGHVAGSNLKGNPLASGIELVGFEDGKRLSGLDAGGAAPGLFYLPEATGVQLFQDSPVNLRGKGVYGSDFTNLQSMDTGKYKNITDIYDLYGEDAYMAALGELQKQGVDIDQYDLPVFFDRPSMFDPNNPMTSSKTGFTAKPADLVRSRASRSTEGRVVSGTGRMGDPAMTGGTGKMATQGSGGRGQRELLNYFQRQAERARQEFGPNSKEAKEAEDLIAQNFGSGGKMYGMGGMTPIKNYGYGGKY